MENNTVVLYWNVTLLESFSIKAVTEYIRILNQTTEEDKGKADTLVIFTQPLPDAFQ